MSETTAFLAGSAVAGVAALLMLKSGGLSLSQPEVLQPYAQTPSSLVTQAPIVGPTLPDSNSNPEIEALLRSQLDTNKGATDELKLQLEQQRFLTEQLKLQLEQQRDTTAQLKAQLEDQRREATGVIDRLRDQQRSMDMLTLQQALPREEDPSLLEQAQLLQTIQNRDSASSTQVVTLWALGGILLILILGGGIILVSVIVILIQQQRKPNKPVPVVHHPITMPLSYNQLPYGANPARRSPLILPPYVRRTPPSPNTPYPPYNPYTNSSYTNPYGGSTYSSNAHINNPDASNSYTHNPYTHNSYTNPYSGNVPDTYRDIPYRDNSLRDWEV